MIPPGPLDTCDTCGQRGASFAGVPGLAPVLKHSPAHSCLRCGTVRALLTPEHLCGPCHLAATA